VYNVYRPKIYRAYALDIYRVTVIVWCWNESLLNLCYCLLLYRTITYVRIKTPIWLRRIYSQSQIRRFCLKHVQQHIIYLYLPVSTGLLRCWGFGVLRMFKLTLQMAASASLYSNWWQFTLLAVHDHIIKSMSEQTKSYCFMSPWSFCCIWYYWSFYSPSSALF